MVKRGTAFFPLILLLLNNKKKAGKPDAGRPPPRYTLTIRIGFGTGSRLYRSTFLFGLSGVLAYRGHEVLGSRRRADLSFENVFERHFSAVKNVSVVIILFHDGTVQFETGKHSARARIGKHFRSHLPIGVGFGLASHGTSGGGGFSGEVGPLRLFNDQMFGQIAWFIPLAVICLTRVPCAS